MRIIVVNALLMFIVLHGALFAQGGGGGGAAATATTTVENQAAQGGFIGVGSSTGFVGVHDVLNRLSTRTTSTARATTAAARPRTAVATTSAAQRRATTAGTSQFGGAGNQTIRSATSFDFAPFDVNSGGLSMQRPLPAIETSLARIQGIQDSQISVTNSQSGTTAVLTGSVASDRERRVAQQLLLLEPGINRVENLLEVR